jgi:hypothetical protein
MGAICSRLLAQGTSAVCANILISVLRVRRENPMSTPSLRLTGLNKSPKLYIVSLKTILNPKGSNHFRDKGSNSIKMESQLGSGREP